MSEKKIKFHRKIVYTIKMKTNIPVLVYGCNALVLRMRMSVAVPQKSSRKVCSFLETVYLEYEPKYTPFTYFNHTQNRCFMFTIHTPVEITGLATGWRVAGARDGWLGTG